MTLPLTIALVPVTGRFADLLGRPQQGVVTFTLSAALNAPQARLNIGSRPVEVRLIDGAFTVRLPANNDPDTTPLDTHYSVVVALDGEPARQFPMRLPFGRTEPLDLSDVPQVRDTSGTIRWAQLPDVPWGVLTVDDTGGVTRLRWPFEPGRTYMVCRDAEPVWHGWGGEWVDRLEQAPHVYTVLRVGAHEPPLTVAYVPGVVR